MTVEHKPQIPLNPFQQEKVKQSIALTMRLSIVINDPDKELHKKLNVVGQESIRRELIDSGLTPQQTEEAIAAATANKLQEDKSKPTSSEKDAYKETGSQITIDQGFVWREAHAVDMGKRIGSMLNGMQAKQAEIIRFKAWRQLVKEFDYKPEEAYEAVGIVPTENTLERNNISKSRLSGVLYEANQALKSSSIPQTAKSK